MGMKQLADYTIAEIKSCIQLKMENDQMRRI